MTEERFDDLLKEIREEKIPQGQIMAAKERVWKRLAGSASLACAEFRPQLRDYSEGRLMESRHLLVSDHLSRCVECRRALAEIKGERKISAMPPIRPSRWAGRMRWAAAAAIVLAALYLGRDHLDSAFAPSGPRATIASSSGILYRLPQETLEVGSALMEGDVVRTPAGGQAILQLADGSRIEMNERTELTVHAAWSGCTIRLDRGDIIVQASKQRRGNLKVRTRDSVASVKGTIFSVSAGAAGSLISVVEGSVEVSQSGLEEVLAPGQQAASSYALQQVDIQEAISWSQDAERYYTLLAAFIRIEKQIAEMPGPALRTEARLMPHMPVGTIAYFAIPNLEDTIRQALVLIEQHASENPVINEWWASEKGQRVRQTLGHIQAFTTLLGDEIVLLLAKDPTDAADPIPLMLANILPGRETALREAFDDIIGNSPETSYKIVQDLLLVSDNPSHLNTVAAQLGSGASSQFAAEIYDHYRRGVSWLVGIDVVTLAPDFQQSLPSRVLGLSNMRCLFFEYGSGASPNETEVTFSFEDSRRGILSWLASPGASGSFEYISAEAVIAVSASSRNPREAFDELLSIASQNGDFAVQLHEFESETGVRIGDDIASSLGTDFAFAVERPSLPIPGWVVAFEVLNPGVLDEAVCRLVDAFNLRVPPEKSETKLTLAQETVLNRSWRSLKSGLSPITLYWTYDRGYLIASMDRALADRAIAIRNSGLPLVRSAAFQQRFPASAGLHNSGFFWFNTNDMLADLAPIVQNPALANLVGNRDPILIIVDGGMEQIRAASRTRLTSLLLDVLLSQGAIRQN